MGFLFGSLDPTTGASPAELLQTAAGGSHRWASGDLLLVVGEERPRGWCGLLERHPGAAVAVYGDRLSAHGKLAATLDPDDLLDACRRGFARFAGALCTTDRLVLWTDEDATCPLFYTFGAGGAPVFASEAKALVALRPQGSGSLAAELPGSRGERPLPAVGETVFAGVRAVPPGCRAIFRRTAEGWVVEAVERCFEPAPAAVETDLEAAVEQVAAGLDSAVRRLVADLDEVHVTLSGGVDSSAVAALARLRVRRMCSYTVGTPFGDEFAQAREVARWLDSEHRELMMTPEDLEELLPELLWELETWDPLTLQIAAPVAFLYRRLTADNDVFLTGYGADLIFAGAVDTSLGEEDLEGLIRHQVALTVPTHEMAPAFARRAGVVLRYPYWSPEVKNLALRLRARLKVRDGEVKFVLRSAVERFLPRPVAWRPKQGIHQGSAMGAMFREVLGTGDPAEQARLLRQTLAEVFDHRLVRAPAEAVLAGGPFTSEDSP